MYMTVPPALSTPTTATKYMVVVVVTPGPVGDGAITSKDIEMVALNPKKRQYYYYEC
jgi:hypothetical protein